MTDTKDIKFIWKTYKDLSNDELYAILHLRQKVFVLEQDCPYIDADYSDQDAIHLLALNGYFFTQAKTSRIYVSNYSSK